MTIEELHLIFCKHPIVLTDSRKIEKGGLFFALKGDNFDGNKYAAQALEKGAAFAIVDDPSVCQDDRFLLFDNVLKTLQDLARKHRRQFHIPVIAITGSNGKTTTKELLSTVMASHYKTHWTRGNFNNHIGVPLTLLSMPLDTEVAVIEMGANHQGEIDGLCRIAEPTHGLITNIGKAHLEGFGGLEGVKIAKSELYRYLAETDGVAFINQDERWLSQLAKPVKKKLFYKKSEHPNPLVPEYEVKLLNTDPCVKVAFLKRSGELIEVSSNLIGAYNFNNMLTAISLGKYFKVPGENIRQAIESYLPTNNRSQIIQKESNTYILDAYNANVSSMQAALKNFGDMESSHKVAILGDMLELGTYSESAHQEIALMARELNLDQLILVGKAFKKAATKFGIIHFEETTALKDWFLQQKIRNCLILIKGSRGIRLEKLLQP